MRSRAIVDPMHGTFSSEAMLAATTREAIRFAVENCLELGWVWYRLNGRVHLVVLR